MEFSIAIRLIARQFYNDKPLHPLLRLRWIQVRCIIINPGRRCRFVVCCILRSHTNTTSTPKNQVFLHQILCIIGRKQTPRKPPTRHSETANNNNNNITASHAKLPRFHTPCQLIVTGVKQTHSPVEGIAADLPLRSLKWNGSTPFFSASGQTLARNAGPKATPTITSLSSSRMSTGEIRST